MALLHWPFAISLLLGAVLSAWYGDWRLLELIGGWVALVVVWCVGAPLVGAWRDRRLLARLRTGIKRRSGKTGIPRAG